MAILTSKKRYRIGGDFSMRDREGEPRHFSAGDELPAELLAMLSPASVDVLLGNATLREIGAPPAREPAAEPPKPPTVAETLYTAGWLTATVVDGQVTGGPRGYALTVLDKAPRDRDLKAVVAWPGAAGDTPVLVHPIDGVLVATVTLARLAQLLALSSLRR
jgi:hypothetical protein